MVTPSHFNAPRDQVGSAISVFDQTDLNRRGNRSVSDTLRRLPGIAVSRSGGPGQLTSIRLRGTESNHVLVMIDGIEVNDPASVDAFYVDALTVDDLARIEVVRGPQSSLYGTDAPGWVILLSSRESGGPTESSVRAEFGSHATHHLHLGANGQIGQLGLSIGAGWHRTDGILALDDGQPDLEQDGSEARAIRLRADVPIGALTIDAVLTGHTNDVEYDGYQQPNATNYRGDRESTLGRLGVAWRPGEHPPLHGPDQHLAQPSDQRRLHSFQRDPHQGWAHQGFSARDARPACDAGGRVRSRPCFGGRNRARNPVVDGVGERRRQQNLGIRA